MRYDHLLDQSSVLAQRLTSCRDLSHVRSLHCQIRDHGLGNDRFLANHLIKMYGRCGSVSEALVVFQSIREPNVYSWNLLIAAYAQNGHPGQAKDLYDRMPQRSIVAANSILSSYSCGGWIQEARDLFDSIKDREKDVITWTAMVAAYAQNGHIHEAKNIFEKMPERNLVSWNSMLAGYAQAGTVSEAERLFDQMPRRDLVSWTAMITAYSKAGIFQSAIKAFVSMDLEGFQADSVSFSATIDSCNSLEDGKRLHHEVLESSSSRIDVVVLTSVIAMYGRCLSIEEARIVFDNTKNTGLIERTVLPWNAMIVSYAQCGRGHDAVELFLAMDLNGIRANEFTFASVFDACSSCGSGSSALACGKIIHAALIEESPNCCTDDVVVGTSLVTMYGKSGSLDDSKRAFDNIKHKNVMSVTAMIEAYSQAGLSGRSLELFRGMGLDGFEPDAVSFVSILSACSHGGLLDEGCQIFLSIRADYGIYIREEHYMCLIDLLGRAGKIDNAMEVIRTMPYKPNSVSWTSLLSGCARQGDAVLTNII